MIRFKILFLFLLVSLSSISNANDITDKVTNYLKSNRYRSIHRLFDKNLKSKLSVKRLKKTWTSIEKFSGKLIKKNNCSFMETKALYSCEMQLEKGLLLMKIALNEKGKISSIFFSPLNYRTPAYKKQEKILKSYHYVKSDTFKMPAELYKPVGKTSFPIVIMVHGSGAHDMYETIGPNKVFLDLVYGLLEQGIGAFIYEKRSKTYSKLYDSFQYTIYEETVTDAVNAFNYIKKTPGIDSSKIFILGHSLGGYALPLILKQCPSAAGGISLAGASRPIEDLILEQIPYIYNTSSKHSLKEKLIYKKTMKIINKKVSIIKSDLILKVKAQKQFLGYWPTSFWIQNKTYQPLLCLDSLYQNMLFLQGERDYQVTLEDFSIWKSKYIEQKGWHFIQYPALNHLFQEGEGKSKPVEYFQPKNIPEYVIKDISNWILQ